jgi:DNA-binding MarR family transcriptional regulator
LPTVLAVHVREDTTMTTQIPPATAVTAVTASPIAALEDLLRAFRILQLHHARVLHHESTLRGLNPTDVRFVFFLSAAGGAGVTPKQGGEYLELSTGAMTSLVDRLERQGYLERRPNPEDRRSVLVHLTESGESVAKAIGDVYRSVFRDAVPSESFGPLALAFDRMAVALESQADRVASPR